MDRANKTPVLLARWNVLLAKVVWNHTRSVFSGQPGIPEKLYGMYDRYLTHSGRRLVSYLSSDANKTRYISNKTGSPLTKLQFC